MADAGDQSDPHSVDPHAPTATSGAQHVDEVEAEARLHEVFVAARAANRRSGWHRYVVHPWRQVVLTEHPAWERFFAERCPHLAGMIAYFGILSIIPAAFLFVSLLSFAGYLEAQGWIVRQLAYVMPEQGVDTIVRTVNLLRERAGSLGLIGALGLVWGTTNFFSCIESGLNIIYGVSNRVFIKQKALVLLLMVAALTCMVLGVIAVTLSTPLLKQGIGVADDVLHINVTEAGISVVVSFAFTFLFFLSCYRFLPNTQVETAQVWRGAMVAAFFFELSIHFLPLYLTYNRDGVVLKAFAGALIVLIWFYIVSFVLLVGGVINWWQVEKQRLRSLQG